MTIAAGPDELARDEIALLREQVREQRVARDVERHAEEHIGTALVHLAGQTARRHVQLKERVAWHEPHALELTHVPGAHHDAARIGVAPELLDRLRDLLAAAAIRRTPGAPLPA